MAESARQALVVPVVLTPHNNADSLSIIQIDGYTVVGNTESWKGKTKGCYIKPQTIVKTTRPEFEFLKKEGKDTHIIRNKCLRGVWSMGLLIPVDDSVELGTDLWNELELEHYEPEEQVEGLRVGNCSKAPSKWGHLPKYDLECWRAHKYWFNDGESIYIFEKANGSNCSCVFSDGEFHVKSRNLWKKNENCDFWKGLNNSPELQEYLRQNPDHVVQGELIGKVKGYTYGLTNGQVEIRVFDIVKPNNFYMDMEELHEVCKKYNLKTPRLFAQSVPYSEEEIFKYVEGDQENNPKGIREGIVIKPAKERYTHKGQRVILKLVSQAYLNKA